MADLKLADLPGILARIDERLDALESGQRSTDADVQAARPDQAEAGRLKWFMKHGRKRPW